MENNKIHYLTINHNEYATQDLDEIYYFRGCASNIIKVDDVVKHLVVQNIHMFKMCSLISNYKLEFFDCSNNEISELPKLPENIKHLDCRNNFIYELPLLPNSLEYLDCSYNYISKIDILPTNIKELYCDELINKDELLNKYPNVKFTFIKHKQLKDKYPEKLAIQIYKLEKEMKNILENIYNYEKQQ